MKLVLVPTPIGHLDDITLRALHILREAEVILSEDTRQTRKLLAHYAIEKRPVSYHQNNEHRVLEKTIQLIRDHDRVALVTDAGTPGISDPGFLLVRECIREGIAVECLPGPTAFVPALVISGLPCERFVYEGFLPHKKGRETRFRAIAAEERTTVMYESPHRLIKTLEQLAFHCGSDRPCAVSRELTKHFEETLRGTVSEVLAHFQLHEPRGEFVIVLGGARPVSD